MELRAAEDRCGRDGAGLLRASVMSFDSTFQAKKYECNDEFFSMEM